MKKPIKLIKLNQVTVQISDVKYYYVKSILEVAESPSLPFFNEAKSKSEFLKRAKQIYLPFLEFVLSQKVKINLVITGDFLETAAKFNPKIIKLIVQGIQKKLIILVADAFYGETLTCLYNWHWWQTSVQKTIKTAEEIFQTKVEAIFLPQLYRRLPLEHIVNETGINNFILRQKGKRKVSFSLKLSELRRFNGNSPEWITASNDRECYFYFSPDPAFFEVNQLVFSLDSNDTVKAFTMAAGLEATNLELKSKEISYKLSAIPRINENYSLAYYPDMEKAVIRIWQYLSTLIISEYEHRKTPFIENLFQEFAKIQNSDFLFYLRSSIYPEGEKLLYALNFVSPYEAFAYTQAILKQIEILLKNKI